MKFVYYEINYLFLYLQLLKDFFKVFEYLKYEIKKKKRKDWLMLRMKKIRWVWNFKIYVIHYLLFIYHIQNAKQ